MADEISRRKFFEKNGFKMTNPYWAWSGVNKEKKLVMFNVCIFWPIMNTDSDLS